MRWQGKRVLVTGGAGFLGSNLVRSLLEVGAQVSAFDNLMSGTLENLADLLAEIEFRQGDVRDCDAVGQAISGQEVVFHLAANADVPYSVEHPQHNFEVNVVGTQNVMNSCMETGVGRLIFASSAAVYGVPNYTPMDEEHPLNPVSPYGASKLAGEHLGFSYHKTYGLPFSAIRISNSYGEGQSKYVMYDVLAKLLRDPDHLEILGDGEQKRNFCYVSDVCRSFLLVAESDQTTGEALNLAGTRPISIRQLTDLILDVLGLLGRTQVSFTQETRPGDIALLLPDAAKIQRMLGFVPQVPLREGLTKLIDWLQARRGWDLRSLKAC